MPAVPRILIAHDGSAPAEAALTDLARAGLPAKAQARIVSAAPLALPPAYLPGEADAWYSQGLAALELQNRGARKTAEATAREAAKTLKALFPGWTVTTETSEADPAEAILDAAERWKASLIVLGAHGRGALDRMLLGSVSRRVLAHATVDVRVSRARGRARKGPARVLIATDGSPHSQAAAQAAASRAWKADTLFRLLVVADYRVSFALEGEAGEASARGKWKKLAARIAEKPLEELARRGFKAELTVREGDPRTEILGEAKRFRADALFVGSHGHGALRRFLLGSTSFNTAEHAPCTVEVSKGTMRAMREGKKPGARSKPRKSVPPTA
jgi:nucleotide-binding universal stress UspA family protein